MDRGCLVNGFGAFRGGIVRVHNSVCLELAQRYPVFIANAPRDQVRVDGATVISRQTASRLKSFSSDLVRSLAFDRFLLRVDTAPAFRPFTRCDVKITIVHDLNFRDPAIHGISWKNVLYRWLLNRWAVRTSDVLVVNSRQTRDELTSFVPGCAGKVEVLPLPVSHVTPTARRPRRPPSATITILTFAHARNKGVEQLLGVLQRRPEFQVTAICPIEVWAELWADEVDRLGLVSRVVVEDRPSDDRLASLYVEHDVFCMLSRYEGYGIPVAEALSLATPTVISDLDVLRQTGQGHAVVAPLDDVDAIGAAIDLAMATDAAHWEAASRAFRGWTWSSWVDEMLKALPHD